MDVAHELPLPPDDTRWVIWKVPPKAALVAEQDRPTKVRLSLWQNWLEVAEHHAALAEAARPTDWTIDRMAAALNGHDDLPALKGSAPTEGELVASMVAIAASAHALDGLYGSVKPLVNPPASRARRARQILETLKLGFAVGRPAQQWLGDLDWLFELRDSIVHHAEAYREVVVTRTTERTVEVGGVESFNLSAESARRAATLVAGVIQTCIEHPKASTREWAERTGRGAVTVGGSEAGS